MQYAVIGAQRAMGSPFFLVIPDDRAAGMAVEDPLGGVVGVGFGQAIGVLVFGDLGPVFEVEGKIFKY